MSKSQYCILYINYDFVSGNELSYITCLESLNNNFITTDTTGEDEIIETNCLSFFNFDNLDKIKDVIVRNKNREYISLKELLENNNIYCEKEIRLAHNVYKMLVAGAFKWNTSKVNKEETINTSDNLKTFEVVFSIVNKDLENAYFQARRLSSMLSTFRLVAVKEKNGYGIMDIVEQKLLYDALFNVTKTYKESFIDNMKNEDNKNIQSELNYLITDERNNIVANSHKD